MERAFINRTEAGRLLAEKLEKYADRNDVVLGLPRGGVRERADFALRQLQKSEEELSMRWKCKIVDTSSISLGQFH
jgi:predicted phosphoribosyltransferase